MTKGDEVGTHGIVYGLCKPDLSVSARIERCNGCNSVNFCISELQESVASACQVPHASISEVIVNDAFQIIKNASCKLELYRGHRVRVTNQQVHLEKIIKDMEKKYLENKRSSEALVVSDWKMIFEAMSSRKTSQQHFAKRGIGWHGCLCLYFKYEEQSWSYKYHG